MSRVQVKICGLTRVADVEVALDAGADAVGFVFAKSPRQVSASQAARLAQVAAGRARRVGLFLDATIRAVEQALESVELDLLQFHGREDNAFCRAFGLPFLKAISALEASVDRVILSYPDAEGVLLDSHAPGGAGGTGRTFDWDRQFAADKPIWLAGGLNPDNVADAIRRLRPFAVDVSSGVESSPGEKDADRVRQFISNAKQARA